VEAEGVHLHIKQSLRICTILHELMKNAIQHGCGAITVFARQDGERVEIGVTDEGPGFPEGFVACPGSNPFDYPNKGLGRVESARMTRSKLPNAETYYENLPGGGARVRVAFDISPGC
jgi:two-component sensor histidine kinase